MAEKGRKNKLEIMFHLNSHGIGFHGTSVVHDNDLPLREFNEHVVPGTEIASSTPLNPGVIEIQAILKAREDTVLGHLEQLAREN